MQENAEGDVQVGGSLPTQRTESALPPQGFSSADDTVVLPAFVTGRKPSEPKPAEPARHLPAPSLPPSEKGMLIFVAALLGVGTIAVVGLLGLGGLGHSSGQKPSASASSLAPAPGAVDSPSPSPSPSPSASPSLSPTKRASATPKRSTSLGTLTQADPYAYCIETKHTNAQPPDSNNASWACVSRGHVSNFAPADVCQWRYNDTTAYALVGTLSDPTSWRCYT